MEKQQLRQESNSETSKRMKATLKASITSHGNFRFSEDRWYYSKRHTSSRAKKEYMLNFRKVPLAYRETVKYYALSLAISPSKIQEKVYKIADFLILLIQNFQGMPLRNVTNKQVNAFEQWLQSGNRSPSTNYLAYSSLHSFFTGIIDLGEAPENLPTKKINPFKRVMTKRTDKYIPKEGVTKLDHFFKSETSQIPLEFRLLYWLMRSFPNRISELMSMDKNCLTQEPHLFLLHIPTYKQNGGYVRPEMKKIPILYEGHGKYLIDLIIKWKQKREQYLKEYVPYRASTFNKNALFLSSFWKFEEKEGQLEVVSVTGFGFNDTIKNLTPRTINTRLAELAHFFHLKDEEGAPLKITTHYFRHNAITDRLYISDYTSEQLQKLTGHKNEQMAHYYTHPQKEHHSRLNQEILAEEPTNFIGKILQFNQFTIHHLTKNQDMYGVSDMVTKKSLGVCSSMVHCQPNGIPDRFCCYFCEWFIPEARFIESYSNEQAHWEKIASQLRLNQQCLNKNEQKKMDQALSITQQLASIIKQLDISHNWQQSEIKSNLENGEVDDE